MPLPSQSDSVPVTMVCENEHTWAAWLDLDATHGSVYRPKYCPVCGNTGDVVIEVARP